MVKVVCPLSGLRDLMHRYGRLAREPRGWRPAGKSYLLRYYSSSEAVDLAYPETGFGGRGGGGGGNDSALRAEIANFAAEVAEKHGDLAAQVQAAQEAVAEFARSSREASERNAEAVNAATARCSAISRQ